MSQSSLESRKQAYKRDSEIRVREMPAKTLACNSWVSCGAVPATYSTVCVQINSAGQTININVLNNWEEKFEEYLADLPVGVVELKEAAPQTEEERPRVFLLKKKIVDTLVEEVAINRNRELNVVIRLDLQKILDQDAGLENLSPAAYSRRGEIYTCIPDMYPAGHIRLRL